MVHTPFHWEGSPPLAPHTQGSIGTPIDLCQAPHNILGNPKLILNHLPKLLPTHLAISLLQIDEGYCQCAMSCCRQPKEVRDQELVILSAMAGPDACLLPCAPA